MSESVCDVCYNIMKPHHHYWTIGYVYQTT